MDSVIRQMMQGGLWKLYAVMAASAAVPCSMLVSRVWYTDSVAFTFLFWNLFLAGIPFAISQWLMLSPPRGRAALLAGLFCWLLFFPNAPYLVTDLMHLSWGAEVPWWFDLVLLLSFAWNGLMLGYLSLLHMHDLIEARSSVIVGWVFSGSALVLGSFGIYLGRFLRWNSWDPIAQPSGLLADITDPLLHPVEHPTAYGVTLVFSAFLLSGYVLLRLLIPLRGTGGIGVLTSNHPSKSPGSGPDFPAA